MKSNYSNDSADDATSSGFDRSAKLTYRSLLKHH